MKQLGHGPKNKFRRIFDAKIIMASRGSITDARRVCVGAGSTPGRTFWWLFLCSFKLRECGIKFQRRQRLPGSQPEPLVRSRSRFWRLSRLEFDDRDLSFRSKIFLSFQVAVY